MLSWPGCPRRPERGRLDRDNDHGPLHSRNGEKAIFDLGFQPQRSLRVAGRQPELDTHRAIREGGRPDQSE